MFDLAASKCNFIACKRSKFCSLPMHQPQLFLTEQKLDNHDTMRVLGVVVNSKLTMKDHLDHLLSSCASSIYALRMLRVHGLQDKQIHVVASMITLASMLYASPAWWGYTTAQDRDRIERLMSRLRRGGYLPPGHPSYEVLAGKADERLLKSITSNPSHVLRKYLPKLKNTGHNLRPRAHGHELPPKDDPSFIPRTLYYALLRKYWFPP